MKLNIFLFTLLLSLLATFFYLLILYDDLSLQKANTLENTSVQKEFEFKNNELYPFSPLRLYRYKTPSNIGFFKISSGVNYPTLTNEKSFSDLNSKEREILNFPIVYQNPELPNGCEITAVTSVFHYYGFYIDKIKMSDYYLYQSPIVTVNNRRYGPDPNIGYAGSPKNPKNGWYAFAGPIEQAAKVATKSLDTNLKTENISGSTAEEIENWLKQGVPVIMWVTLNLEEPKINGGWYINGTNKFHRSYTNLHTVVLLKSTENEVIIMDPLKGYVKHDKTTLFKSYDSLNKQAIVIKDF
ncbi:MAG: C39 family peptidase [Firmicutes bacterium]|nr:C39 family peptidase [Bacillota bacterium]